MVSDFVTLDDKIGINLRKKAGSKTPGFFKNFLSKFLFHQYHLLRLTESIRIQFVKIHPAWIL